MFKGLIVPLITPFDRRGRVDYEGLAKLIYRCEQNGADGFVALGTTAETPTLSQSEQRSIVKFIREKTKLPLIVGAGSNCTRTAVALTKRAEALGADGVLSVCPYYNKPPISGIIDHFSKIASCTELPVILYNVPSRTASQITPEAISALKNTANVAGIKEAGDEQMLRAAAALCDENFAVYGGNDSLAHLTVRLGGAGLISAAANIMTRQFSLISHGATTVDEEGLSLSVKALYSETNPAPVKYALSRLGLIENTLRLPLKPIGKKSEALIERYVLPNL